jgi:NAD(P)-dependent dehydrogenase (short-subunit alcohol dehydrogenase family)
VHQSWDDRLFRLTTYAAGKWALEAIAIEAGHFGVEVSIVQPGAVSSGGGERAKRRSRDAGRSRRHGGQDDRTAPASVARAGRGACRAGAPAEKALRARKEAPEDKSFLFAQIDW